MKILEKKILEGRVVANGGPCQNAKMRACDTCEKGGVSERYGAIFCFI